MISVLLYSRKSETMTQILADQLENLGFSVEQSQIINVPRLILNQYQVIHFVVESLPLTTNEFICLSSAKALGKAVVISILNAKPADKNFLIPSRTKFFNWIYPDAITVSQTNYLKIFRDFGPLKMIVPPLFEMTTLPTADKTETAIQGFIFPLFGNLDEALGLQTEKPVYFDGRELLKRHSSSEIRKKWSQLVKEKNLASNKHLVLSDKKIESLLTENIFGLVVASHEMKPTDFAIWVEASFKNSHLLILNQYQATGFSSHWTSGHNCFVTSPHHWLRDLNGNMNDLIFNQPFAISDFNKTSLDSLFNELSRLYTKIVYQKTSLIESDSAKI